MGVNNYLMFLPYNFLPIGSKLIIYGAGKSGIYHVNSIQQSNKYELVAVVDSQWEHLESIGNGIEVHSPDDLSDYMFDYIVIAVTRYDVACEIRDILFSMDIDEEQIIWSKWQDDDDEQRSLQEYDKFLDGNCIMNKKNCYIFMLPEHGNAGDYAIGHSEEIFLKKYFNDYNLIKVTTNEWYYADYKIQKLVRRNDIIFLNGGGYIGDLWGNESDYMSVVEAFPNNDKVFFPNTITYKENKNLQYLPFVKEMEWFKRQDKLYTMFRDRKSYEEFRKYDSRCFLYPDMVLFNHYSNSKIEKISKVLLCFRNDRERIFNSLEEIKNILKNNEIGYDELDINAGKYISQKNGYDFVKSVSETMQKYDCVLTDRLHGMILSVISDVPCIAFDNITNKVSGVYEWIESCGYAICLKEKDVPYIYENICEVIAMKKQAGEYIPLIDIFESMAKQIRLCINGEVENEEM